MNLNEFKAFIEGIEHAFGGEAPNAAQWLLIKDKLHQLETDTTPKYPIKRDPVFPTNPLDQIRNPVWQEPHITYRGNTSTLSVKDDFERESG